MIPALFAACLSLLVAVVLRAAGLPPQRDPGAAAQAVAAGAGLPGYAGSDLCAACHPEQARGWERSLHARTIRPPSEHERGLLSRSLLCGDEEPKYVLGERHARRFMVDSEVEPGRHVLLPCRYDVGAAAWTHLHESDWRELTWERSCGACHTTGFSSDGLTYNEMRVGCESCHGAARLHGDFASRGDMVSFAAASAEQEVTICASCHLQGGRSRRTELNFAYNYEPGGDLFADYAFDWSELDRAPATTGNPIDVHQKLLVRDAVARRAGGSLRCTTCHSLHEMGHGKHAREPRQEYCHLCHESDGFSLKGYSQSCNVCEF